jgi:hypothetical protein
LKNAIEKIIQLREWYKILRGAGCNWKDNLIKRVFFKKNQNQKNKDQIWKLKKAKDD